LYVWMVNLPLLPAGAAGATLPPARFACQKTQCDPRTPRTRRLQTQVSSERRDMSSQRDQGGTAAASPLRKERTSRASRRRTPTTVLVVTQLWDSIGACPRASGSRTTPTFGCVSGIGHHPQARRRSLADQHMVAGRLRRPGHDTRRMRREIVAARLTLAAASAFSSISTSSSAAVSQTTRAAFLSTARVRRVDRDAAPTAPRICCAGMTRVALPLLGIGFAAASAPMRIIAAISLGC
jgi:hypothetical protein